MQRPARHGGTIARVRLSRLLLLGFALSFAREAEAQTGAPPASPAAVTAQAMGQAQRLLAAQKFDSAAAVLRDVLQ